MAALQLSVGVVADLSYGANDARTARVSAIESFLFVDSRVFDLVLVEVAAGGGHGGELGTELSS